MRLNGTEWIYAIKGMASLLVLMPTNYSLVF